MNSLEVSLKWIIRIGSGLLLLTPIILTRSMYFPFITGKNFYFRIIVEIIFFAWIVLAALEPEYRPRKGWMLYIISAFFLVVGLATIFGVNPYHSFWSDFERMEGFVTYIHLYALFLVLAHSFRAKKEWLWIVIASLFVSSIVSGVTILEKYDVITSLSTESRPFATFGNYIYLAVYLMVHVFIILGLMTVQRSRGVIAALAGLLIVHIFAFSLPASRGAFVGLIAGAGIICLLALLFGKNKHIRASALALLLVGILSLILIRAFPNSNIVRRVPVLSRVADTSLSSIQNQPRVLIWGMAIEASKERPILGWGPGNFIIPYAKYYNPKLFGNEPWFDRTHNVFLDWLTGAGFLGLLSYMGLLATAIYLLWSSWKKRVLADSAALFMAGGFTSYLVQNFFVFDTITTYLTLIFFIAFLHSISAREILSTKPIAKTQAPLLGAVATVVVMLLIFFVNVRPIMAARRTVDMLGAFQQQATADQVTQALDRVTSLNTFGSREARERFGVIIMEYAIGLNAPDNAVDQIMQKAIVEVEKDVAKEPLVVKHELLLARLLTIQSSFTGKDYDKAETHYRRIIEIAPNYVQTHLTLAELYLSRGDKEKALASVERAYDLGGGVRNLVFPIVNVYLSQNKAEDAQLFLDQEVISKPDFIKFSAEEVDTVMRRTLGITSPPERLKFVEYIITHANPGVDTAITNLVFAQTHAEMQNKVQAAAYAKKAAEIDPQYKASVDSFIQALGV